MAKTKQELVTFMQARRNIANAYAQAVTHKIYKEYVNNLQKAILNDDVQPLSINKFDVKNLINQLSPDDKRDILNDIRETLPDIEYDDFVAAQDEIIETFLVNISETETYDEDTLFPEDIIQIYDFNYDDVLNQLTALFEKNGYAPEVYADYNPKKIVIKIM